MKNEHYNPSVKELKQRWYVIDAKGKRLGKVAARVAMVLMGKHEAGYVPHLDNGHRVVVINAAHLDMAPRKLAGKIYYRHSGHPGGLHSRTLAELYEVQPTEVVRKAVKGMLPKNRLGSASLKKLYIYAEEAHEQQAQQPESLEV